MFFMKARLPQGYNTGGTQNIQHLAKQAQKMQEQMDEATAQLEEKEYNATSGGGAVNVTVTGKLELKAVEFKARGRRPRGRGNALRPDYRGGKRSRCARPPTTRRRRWRKFPAGLTFRGCSDYGGI